ncbi:MAG: hypothetical protein GY757_25265, partial [bacterium]|nr:hypothetical protein [bacterium]
LLKTAGITPYNRLAVSRLQEFAYDSFQEQHKLNRDIYNRVKECLSAGNVDEVFLFNLKGILQIERHLKQIGQEVAGGKVPELGVVWKINAMFTESHLFGQYVARVFHSLGKAQ